ncbi:type I-E CRISPR-associated protein Cas6/Cse3/CasE [Marinomonas fungiae]|uniref:type I-E CRISPR-associated protein Cas6/Cse3/CasE n=1 Tax=Marinomonas fungiae TaxID=1137284 RepID=UPI003A8E8DBE
MFLSKVSFQSSEQARQLLASFGGKGVYSSHQLLWQLFTSDDARSFLFRQEQDAAGKSIFYVQSSRQPDVDSSVFNVQSKEFLPKLEAGQRLSFKLRANPVISTKDEQGKAKRNDVMMHAKKQAKVNGIQDSAEIQQLMEQAAQRWLATPERLGAWGITLDVLPNIENYQQHRSKKSKDRMIQFSSVDYQGILTVQDPIRFLTQLESGFGKAKALGCGLMLIKPI